MHGCTWLFGSNLPSEHCVALLRLPHRNNCDHRFVSVIKTTFMITIVWSTLTLLIGFFVCSLVPITLVVTILDTVPKIYLMGISLFLFLRITVQKWELIGAILSCRAFELRLILETILLQQSQREQLPSLVLLFDQSWQCSPVPRIRTVADGLTNHCNQ